ncbi:putative short chain oxidoreductase/dehydrogenase [Rhizodiscina lignyota]|uniref:Short chain oxidoreductase/dehydrogenase n=1 Tax=Rhizodiscina lignyota TaxID=1504668 RepID=A0A9P4I4W3_9PEZI|nr:putative short chain oxidoreductase/dehydrogenase [Rhizodiscina lignyota]
MAPTWFITGCSSGFGYEIALKALSEGHNVIASSRNPSKNTELVDKITSGHGGRGKWVQFDVNAPLDEIKASIADAEKLFGGIDVLVNNAGYMVSGAMEDIPEEKYRENFETNFFGPMKIMKAVLPGMRERKAGTIVNISSIAGITALPTASSYSGSKWALEALSESLSAEVTPWNIRVLLVEPGFFRTNFLGSGAAQQIPVSEAYRGTICDQIAQHVGSMAGKQPGSPEKAASRIFEAATGTGMAEGKTEHLRLVLGQGAWDRWTAQIQKYQKNLEATKEIAKSADY